MWSSDPTETVELIDSRIHQRWRSQRSRRLRLASFTWICFDQNRNKIRRETASLRVTHLRVKHISGCKTNPTSRCGWVHLQSNNLGERMEVPPKDQLKRTLQRQQHQSTESTGYLSTGIRGSVLQGPGRQSVKGLHHVTSGNQPEGPTQTNTDTPAGEI